MLRNSPFIASVISKELRLALCSLGAAEEQSEALMQVLLKFGKPGGFAGENES